MGPKRIFIGKSTFLEETAMSQPDTVALTGDHGLGTVRTMPQFRSHITQGALTDAQRRRSSTRPGS